MPAVPVVERRIAQSLSEAHLSAAASGALAENETPRCAVCPRYTITITITIKILLLQLDASCETALRHPSCPRRKLRIVPSEKQKTSSRAAAHGKAQPHPQHGTKTRETQLHPRSPNHPEGASKHANDQASPQPKATPPTPIKQLSTEKSLILSWRPP